jgi:hypothetical protein
MYMSKAALISCDLGNLAHRTVISWRHSGDIDRYWYVYRIARDAVRSFSKLLETLTFVRVTYVHVWERVAGWVGKKKNTRIVVMRIGYIF